MTCEEFFLCLPKDRVRRCGATSNWIVKSSTVEEVVIEAYTGGQFVITPENCQEWRVLPRLAPRPQRTKQVQPRD